MKGKEIAKRDSGSALAALGSVLDEEAQGYDPQIIRMKIIHESGEFQIPSLPSVKRLEGIILASRRIRVFFPDMAIKGDKKRILDFTNKRPFCSSPDCATGILSMDDFSSIKDKNSPIIFLKNKIAEGAGLCKKCPLAEWGSVSLLGQNGRGQACKELRRLLYWQPGMSIPVLLSISTSSIRSWDQYCSALNAAGTLHNKVVTELDLNVVGEGDETYSIVEFSKSGEITEEMAEELVKEVVLDGRAQPLVKALVAVFRGRDIEQDDYPNGHTEDDL